MKKLITVLFVLFCAAMCKGQDFHLQFDSPAIDAGTDVGLDTDFEGNPIYGPPDMGGYEYQPPFTMGIDKLPVAAVSRVYGDEKYRIKSLPTDTLRADLSVSLDSTILKEWLDIRIIYWNMNITKQKTWMENTSIPYLSNVGHVVGNLTPNTQYDVLVDNILGNNITGINCVAGTCLSDAAGRLSFTYTGIDTAHVFNVRSSIENVLIYYNAQQSVTATKNDCATGYAGSTVTYTVTAGKYSSNISQAHADGKATDDLNANKQVYANANGTCTLIPVTTYYNVQKSGAATRNNCGSGFTGSTVTYTVPANTYSSTVSQADANNQAIADVNNNKQAYANANGTCTATITVYYNVQKTGTATKNDCASGYAGSTVTYTVKAGKYSSTVSQADADSKATSDVSANKQNYANANGTCTANAVKYYNTQVTVTATRNNCHSGYTGTSVAYTVRARAFSSLISQADAQAKALASANANKQAYANSHGHCNRTH